MIPVSIVTGFLGSGKTTLISRLLRDPAPPPITPVPPPVTPAPPPVTPARPSVIPAPPSVIPAPPSVIPAKAGTHNAVSTLAARGNTNPDSPTPPFARTAVIVNEFGEIGLDHALVAGGDETMVALTTGCVCCRMQGGLAETLAELASRAGGYARVVVETSGLADPAPLIQALIADPAVTERHRLAGGVTLVDAVHGAATLARHVEAQRQVALADRLVVTKTDLAPATKALLASLTAVNAEAPVLTTGDAAAALFGQSGAAQRLRSLPGGVRHTAGLSSVVIERDRPLPAFALAMWLQTLAEHAGPHLLRVKGIVAVEEMPGRPALLSGKRCSC